MVDHDPHHPSILVIAAWHETDSLRARVTLSDPSHVSGRSSVVVSSRDQLLDVVTGWLDGIKDPITSDAT